MNSGICVDENPLGGEPLRAVAGDRVSVIANDMRNVKLDMVSGAETGA